jgi:hypothetical protein
MRRQPFLQLSDPAVPTVGKPDWAAALGCCTRTIERYVAKGLLPPYSNDGKERLAMEARHA